MEDMDEELEAQARFDRAQAKEQQLAQAQARIRELEAEQARVRGLAQDMRIRASGWRQRLGLLNGSIIADELAAWVDRLDANTENARRAAGKGGT